MWTPKAYYNYRPASAGNSSKLVDYSIPVSRFNEIHDFFDKHPDIYEKVFSILPKKKLHISITHTKQDFLTLLTTQKLNKWAVI